MRPNNTINEPAKKLQQTDSKKMVKVPSLHELTMEIMDNVAKNIHEQDLKNSARKIIATEAPARPFPVELQNCEEVSYGQEEEGVVFAETPKVYQELSMDNVQALSDGDELPHKTSTVGATQQATIDARPDLLAYLDREIDDANSAIVMAQPKSVASIDLLPTL